MYNGLKIGVIATIAVFSSIFPRPAEALGVSHSISGDAIGRPAATTETARLNLIAKREARPLPPLPLPLWLLCLLGCTSALVAVLGCLSLDERNSRLNNAFCSIAVVVGMGGLVILSLVIIHSGSPPR